MMNDNSWLNHSFQNISEQWILESNQYAGRSIWWNFLYDECLCIQSIFAKATLSTLSSTLIVHLIDGLLAIRYGPYIIDHLIACVNSIGFQGGILPNSMCDLTNHFLDPVPWIFDLSSESSLSKSTGIEIPFLLTFVDVGGVGLNGLNLNQKLWSKVLGPHEP